MVIDQVKSKENDEIKDRERRKIIENIVKEVKDIYFSQLTEDHVENIVKTSIISKAKDKEL